MKKEGKCRGGNKRRKEKKHKVKLNEKEGKNKKGRLITKE